MALYIIIHFFLVSSNKSNILPKNVWRYDVSIFNETKRTRNNKFQFHKFFYFLYIYVMLINCFFSAYNSSSKPRFTPRILERRYALTIFEWAWDLCLLWSYLVMIKGFGKIILPHATWKTFKRCLNIWTIPESTAPSSLIIRDLIVELVKTHDINIVNIKI